MRQKRLSVLSLDKLSKDMLTRWQYKYVYLKTDTNDTRKIENMLNQLGDEGWELVDVVDAGQGSVAVIHGYLFKRPAK